MVTPASGPYEHRGPYRQGASADLYPFRRSPDEHGHHPKPGSPPPPPQPDPRVVDIVWPAGRSSWAARALTRAEQQAVHHGQ